MTPANHIEVNAARMARTAFALDGAARPGIDAAAIGAMLERMHGEARWCGAFDDLRRLYAISQALAAGDGLMWRAMECWDVARGDLAVKNWCKATAGFDWNAVSHRFIGVGRVTADADGGARVMPAPPGVRDGRPMIVIPVISYYGGRFNGVWRPGFSAHCNDIVAIDPAEPDKRWRWLGDAGVLHAQDGEFAEGLIWPGRVRLHATALGWLRAGAAGGEFCVLDWKDEDAWRLLRLLDEGRVEALCDDAAYVKWLAGRVRPKRPKLRLGVAAAKTDFSAAVADL